MRFRCDHAVIDAGESLAPHAFLTVCVDCVGLGDFFRLRVICSRVAASFFFCRGGGNFFFFFGRGERIFFYSTDSTDTKLVKSLRRLVFKCVGGGREPTGLRHNRYGRLQETENSLAQKIPRISRRPFRQTTHILPSHCRIVSLRLGEGNSTRWVNIS